MLRCAPNWMKSNQWLRHHAWIQEYAGATGHLRGQRIGQLQLIFTVHDIGARDEYGVPRQHQCVAMSILRPQNGGETHKIRGMEQWPNANRNTKQFLGGTRCYSIGQVLRAAHVLQSKHPGNFVVNNYAAFDEFNTLYNPNFMEDNEEHMKAYKQRWEGVHRTGKTIEKRTGRSRKRKRGS